MVILRWFLKVYFVRVFWLTSAGALYRYILFILYWHVAHVVVSGGQQRDSEEGGLNHQVPRKEIQSKIMCCNDIIL